MSEPVWEGGVGARPTRVGHSPARRLDVGWLSAWSAVLALAIWLSQLAPIWLAPVIVGSGVWTVTSVRARDAVRVGSALLLLLAAGMAGGVQVRLTEIVERWPALQHRVEESSADALEESLDDLLDRGERVVAGAAEAAELYVGRPANPQLFARLEDLQRGTGVSAIALFAPDGSALAWAGEHRGSVPAPARLGVARYLYDEGPLFSHLYFVRPLPDGVTAAAAFLLEASIEAGEGIVPFADRFERRHGTRPRFWTPERVPQEAVWDWATPDGSPILSVSFAALTQQQWWERVVDGGRRVVGMLGLLALLALSLAWYRERKAASGLPVLVWTAALLIAPLGRMTGAEVLFSPLQFVLPGPLDVTLGVLLVLLVGVALWLLTRSERTPRLRLPPWMALVLLALAMPLGLELIDRSAGDGLMASRAAGGFRLQLAAVLLLAIPIYLILKHARAVRLRPQRALVARAAGYLLPALLAGGLLLWWSPGRPIPLIYASAWAIPAALLLIRPEQPGRARYSLRRWLIAGWVAGTLALAFLWPQHLRAELSRAEREIALLGTQPDTFLDFLLRQFSEQADRLAAEGERGVNLLYRSWVASGLAREGYEARMTLWQGGAVESELNLSEMATLSESAVAEVARPREAPAVLHFGGAGGLHYLLVAPLVADLTVSVAVPPRRRLGGATPLAQFLYAGQDRAVLDRGETLHLVPVESEAMVAHRGLQVRPDTVQWVRTEQGWRSETLVSMPEGPVHAHLILPVPGLPLLLARATLILAGILAFLFILWLIARLICRELNAIPVLRARWLRSFRGRLSLALFVFFLLPTVVFGAVSYGAVAREVVRSAAALAHQALDQAAVRLPHTPLAEMRATVPTDLLLYRQGTLAGATAAEVLELGLFHTWLPPDVFLRFAGGEDLQELEERRVAESDYLIAYRRIDAPSVLAAPIPLASREITRRQQAFRDVALLVVLVGLGLSIVLALLVSRALARPLDALGRAAVTVGGGNLRTRLPETRSDEFGSVYASFNQMVSRLDQTRAALVQETRRTETIVAEAATGVLALDPTGRVELINPRATEILGGAVTVGDSLLSMDGSDPLLVAAVTELMQSPSPETGTEFELGGCIIRMKLRRLHAEEGGGGAVIALEDLTAELRTARVLAWGEMARQVAHEIKNPLTPIKLAVQHLRRAFVDRRTDFGDILDRNVESILREIDRLGEISRAFSRFGTPAAAGLPLEAVDVSRVVHEILALYGSSESHAVFRAELGDAAIPPIIARTGELKEVLVNLLENAREAIDGGGEVVVSTGHEGPGWVSISVRDDGVGIPADQLPSIFEPHFSTRSSGTGLGLAIVRRIVDSWGGQIQAESTPGQGSRFQILVRTADEVEVRPDSVPSVGSETAPPAGDVRPGRDGPGPRRARDHHADEGEAGQVDGPEPPRRDREAGPPNDGGEGESTRGHAPHPDGDTRNRGETGNRDADSAA
jgi:two-component system, NtrC family, nitrogen regulation sensor histidine kinase NtrY